LRFQAANPGAEMEDFVRWHSPRDWIEEEIMTPEGRKIEGNGDVFNTGYIFQSAQLY